MKIYCEDGPEAGKELFVDSSKLFEWEIHIGRARYYRTGRTRGGLRVYAETPF